MTNLVAVPWDDGKTRLVEADTLLVLSDGSVVYAACDGFRYRPEAVAHAWKADMVVEGILTRSGETPPEKVTVPDAVGAIVESGLYPQSGATVFPVIQFLPGYWIDLNGRNHTDGDVARLLRGGAVVKHEGMTK